MNLYFTQKNQRKGLSDSILPILVVVFSIVFFPLPSSSDIYHWVDEKGISHYTNEPPPENVRIIEQQKEIPPSSDDELPQDQPEQVQKEQNVPSPNDAAIGVKKEEQKAAETPKPAESEEMTNLKKRLETRTSSESQRKLKRRIKALEKKEAEAIKKAD